MSTIRQLSMFRRYRLILGDPPWDFRNWSADAPGMLHNRARGANKWYPTLTLDQICTMRPPSDKDAVLLLWTTSSHLFEAERVIEAWEFTYRTIAWWWTKTTQDGEPRMGQGYWLRQVGEICLLATKGNPPGPAVHDERAYIEAPRGSQHSRKPVEQYAKIERVFPYEGFYCPRLEMFARQRYDETWDVFGNEVENSITLEMLG